MNLTDDELYQLRAEMWKRRGTANTPSMLAMADIVDAAVQLGLVDDPRGIEPRFDTAEDWHRHMKAQAASVARSFERTFIDQCLERGDNTLAEMDEHFDFQLGKLARHIALGYADHQREIDEAGNVYDMVDAIKEAVVIGIDDLEGDIEEAVGGRYDWGQVVVAVALLTLYGLDVLDI